MTRQNRSVLPRAVALRGICSLALLAMVAACSSQAPHSSSKQEAARYAAHARGNYVPPGPPEDPWGPYIREAGKRFDVPELWIRSVMRVESGGNQYQNGQLITSSAGAMGLMQVMPETYDELQGRYSLGDDPFDPHDNILAGTAYLREMYDIYGSPGLPRRVQCGAAAARRLSEQQPLAAGRDAALRGDDRSQYRRGLSDQPFAGRRLCDECAADRHPARDALRPCDAARQQSWQRRPRADARTGRGGAASRTAATGCAAAAAAICAGHTAIERRAADSD